MSIVKVSYLTVKKIVIIFFTVKGLNVNKILTISHICNNKLFAVLLGKVV